MRRPQRPRYKIQVTEAHFDCKFLRREVGGTRADRLDTTKFGQVLMEHCTCTNEISESVFYRLAQNSRNMQENSRWVLPHTPKAPSEQNESRSAFRRCMAALDVQHDELLVFELSWTQGSCVDVP